MKTKPIVLVVLSFIIFLSIVIGLNSASANSANSQKNTFIRYVTMTGDGNCSTWQNACSLHTALANAQSGDQIWVAAGTYKPDLSDRNATFQLKSGVDVYGGFEGVEVALDERDWVANPTILSGEIGDENIITDNSYHVVTGSSVTMRVDGFTISRGYNEGSGTDGDAGGLYANTSSVTLENVSF